MNELYELKEKLCDYLKDFNRKEISNGNLGIIDSLTHTIKNLDKIIETYEDDEYSNYGGESYEGDGYGGMSRRSMPDRSYARGRGSNARRDSRGRYSSEGYSRSGDLAHRLRNLAADAPDERSRMEIQRLADRMEQM